MSKKAVFNPGLGETLVFRFDTNEQREELYALLKPYMFAESGIRITAMSADHEIQRLSIIEEALERDDCDIRDAVDEIVGCPDLSKWSWAAYLDGDA